MAERGDLSLIEEINSLASREPFAPFAIWTASGQHYAIAKDDVVTVGRGVVMIFRPREGYHVLRQGFITEVDVPGGLS